MAKNTEKLNAQAISKPTMKPGWHSDGKGLYLQVTQTGSKSWAYRYEKAGVEHWHGLGSYPTVSLKEARDKAHNCRVLRDEGIDPIEHKKQQEQAKELEKAKGVTFKECALAYIESHKAGWKSGKHEQQWRNTLEAYAYPIIGKLAVQDVDTGQVLKVLEPIWFDKTETASRVRQRIENILDWAKVRNYRTGENPALWRGHLDKTLPKRAKVQKVKHFAAMPYTEVPEYYRVLRKQKTITAMALAFIILTATRSSEARGATWKEIDLKKKVWSIPDERMKADRPHRVPLSDEAISILQTIKPFRRKDDLVFPGLRQNKFISEAACMKLLKATHPTLTIHGFRSSFRVWCAEMTGYPREVAEAALAHTVKDKTEAAYQRGDVFEKRRKLMDRWTEYCLNGKTASEVVPIKKMS